MNRAEVYPWVTRKPAAHPKPVRRARDDRDCGRCGYGPVGQRKRCPACMAPTGTRRGAP